MGCVTKPCHTTNDCNKVDLQLMYRFVFVLVLRLFGRHEKAREIALRWRHIPYFVAIMLAGERPEEIGAHGLHNMASYVCAAQESPSSLHCSVLACNGIQAASWEQSPSAYRATSSISVHGVYGRNALPKFARLLNLRMALNNILGNISKS